MNVYGGVELHLHLICNLNTAYASTALPQGKNPQYSMRQVAGWPLDLIQMIQRK